MITLAMTATAASMAFTAGALGWAAVSDLRRYVIPNTVHLMVTLAFAVAACFLPSSFFYGGLVTALAVFFAGVVFFWRGWMGGGDVKLLTAMALWCGPAYLSHFATMTMLAGALLAILMLSPLRRFLPPPSPEALELVGAEDKPAHQPMPFGVAIAAGGVYVLALYLPLLH